jgi:hypothetical protein
VSRVKVVPNDYHDDHFDLRDPDQILGKTLVHANREKDDIVGRSEFDLGVIYNFSVSTRGLQREVVSLSLLTNCALVYAGRGGVAGSQPMSTNVHIT